MSRCRCGSDDGRRSVCCGIHRRRRPGPLLSSSYGLQLYVSCIVFALACSFFFFFFDFFVCVAGAALLRVTGDVAPTVSSASGLLGGSRRCVCHVLRFCNDINYAYIDRGGCTNLHCRLHNYVWLPAQLGLGGAQLWFSRCTS